MPKPTLVRRARKSLRERRMKQCLNELTQNLEKVELTVHRHQKKKRIIKKIKAGKDVDPIPASIRRGTMTEELYQLECKLFKQAGIPTLPRRPKYLPEPGTATNSTAAESNDEGRPSAASAERRVGMIPFKTLVAVVRERMAKQADRRQMMRVA